MTIAVTVRKDDVVEEAVHVAVRSTDDLGNVHACELHEIPHGKDCEFLLHDGQDLRVYEARADWPVDVKHE